MNLCHVVNYTTYRHVKLEFQCYFKCIYLDLAVVNIVEGGIDMVDTTHSYFKASDIYIFFIPLKILIEKLGQIEKHLIIMHRLRNFTPAI